MRWTRFSPFLPVLLSKIDVNCALGFVHCHCWKLKALSRELSLESWFFVRFVWILMVSFPFNFSFTGKPHNCRIYDEGLEWNIFITLFSSATCIVRFAVTTIAINVSFMCGPNNPFVHVRRGGLCKALSIQTCILIEALQTSYVNVHHSHLHWWLASILLTISRPSAKQMVIWTMCECARAREYTGLRECLGLASCLIFRHFKILRSFAPFSIHVGYIIVYPKQSSLEQNFYHFPLLLHSKWIPFHPLLLFLSSFRILFLKCRWYS